MCRKKSESRNYDGQEKGSWPDARQWATLRVPSPSLATTEHEMDFICMKAWIAAEEAAVALKVW
jgi:hypothetical protein